jgi:hypothetical protein
MLIVLSGGAWLAGWLLGSPRVAFVAVVGVGVLANLAALPPRVLPEYDERFAYFRTDQPIAVDVQVRAVPTTPALALLVEPVFDGAQPRFGLAGTIGSIEAVWTCQFARGQQRLALPVPTGSISSPGELPVRLRLTGSPSRESDYLLVYASSRQPGLLASVTDITELPPSVTRCALQ